MAHVHHGRLYKSVMGNGLVVSHSCPKNGMIHHGHPRLCPLHESCRTWGKELKEKADKDARSKQS